MIKRSGYRAVKKMRKNKDFELLSDLAESASAPEHVLKKVARLFR
jgi:hypothetical protein